MNSEHPEPILLRDLEFATIYITDQEKKRSVRPTQSLPNRTNHLPILMQVRQTFKSSQKSLFSSITYTRPEPFKFLELFWANSFFDIKDPNFGMFIKISSL